MRKFVLCLALLSLPSCKNTPSQPSPAQSQIVAYVHWQDAPQSGKKIEIVETGKYALTDSTGKVSFPVSPGSYTVRAYDINGPGANLRIHEFKVEVSAGDTAKVDIVDCLPCV